MEWIITLIIFLSILALAWLCIVYATDMRKDRRSIDEYLKKRRKLKLSRKQ